MDGFDLGWLDLSKSLFSRFNFIPEPFTVNHHSVRFDNLKWGFEKYWHIFSSGFPEVS